MPVDETVAPGSKHVYLSGIGTVKNGSDTGRGSATTLLLCQEGVPNSMFFAGFLCDSFRNDKKSMKEEFIFK